MAAPTDAQLISAHEGHCAEAACDSDVAPHVQPARVGIARSSTKISRQRLLRSMREIEQNMLSESCGNGSRVSSFNATVGYSMIVVNKDDLPAQ